MNVLKFQGKLEMLPDKGIGKFSKFFKNKTLHLNFLENLTVPTLAPHISKFAFFTVYVQFPQFRCKLFESSYQIKPV